MSDDLRINDRLSIPAEALSEYFTRASGPGGQHVNKTASAVTLRYDTRLTPEMPDAVRARLFALAGHRLTGDGVIIIEADESRSQFRNRAMARERLAELIRAALKRPVPRIATKPTRASQQRRIDSKIRTGVVKAGRRAPDLDG